MNLRFRLVAAVAVFTALSLHAGDGEKIRKWKFGAQVILAEPQRGLANVCSTGAGLSLFFERSLGKKNKMALRLGQDSISFGEKNGWHSNSFGAILLDFLYRFKSNDVGAYILVGSGLRLTSVNVGDIGYGISRWPVVYSGGVGYNFNRHFGVEARYSTERDDDINSGFPDVEKRGNIQYMQLGVHYRF